MIGSWYPIIVQDLLGTCGTEVSGQATTLLVLFVRDPALPWRQLKWTQEFPTDSTMKASPMVAKSQPVSVHNH